MRWFSKFAQFIGRRYSMADISQRIANAKAEAESMQETINANKAAKADTTRMIQVYFIKF